MESRGNIIDEGRLRFSLLLQLRWASVVAQVCIVVLTAFRSDGITEGLFVVGAGALSNLGVQAWMARREQVSDGAIFSAIIADIVVLTALLAVTGGPMNPFTLLYLVHVATASVALSRGMASLVACVAAVAYGVLFLPSIGGLPIVIANGTLQLNTGTEDGGGFAVHMRGMWLAFALSAFFIVAFIGRLRAALEEREAHIAQMRESVDRARRLGALATLAGGAAHELATPLSTITVIAGELKRRLAAHQDQAISDDLALLLAEVERCRAVLMQLATDAGTVGGEGKTTLRITDLVRDILAYLPADRIRVAIGADAFVHVPRRAVSAAVRGLVKNALEAGEGMVELDVHPAATGTVLAVIDHGAGMDSDTLARVGEPFFTTKEPGAGMGLGVFLARAVVEQTGGSLKLTSGPGAGTRAEITLPA